MKNVLDFNFFHGEFGELCTFCSNVDMKFYFSNVKCDLEFLSVFNYPFLRIDGDSE